MRKSSAANQAAEKVEIASAAPEGASAFERFTASLKRYPDTKPRIPAATLTRNFQKTLSQTTARKRVARAIGEDTTGNAGKQIVNVIPRVLTRAAGGAGGGEFSEGADVDVGGRKVGGGKRAQHGQNGEIGIEVGASGLFLFDGIDLASEKSAVGGEADFEDEGDAVFGGQIEAAIGGEIAEGVGNQMAAVNFHGADDVGAGADDELGSVVDHGVGEAAEIAAIFADEALVAGGYVLVSGAFGASMKRDDDDVGFGPGCADGVDGVIEIKEVVTRGVGGKGDDGDSGAADGQVGDVADFSGMSDAQGIEDVAGTGAPFLPEIEGVIVGQTHDGEAGGLEILSVAGGDAKGIAVDGLGDGSFSGFTMFGVTGWGGRSAGVGEPASALFCSAVIHERAFEIAEDDVSFLQDGRDFLKKIDAIVGRESGFVGKTRAQHDVADG